MASEQPSAFFSPIAKAGYDPKEAVHVWERMAREDGRRPPEFLSTHPDPESRIRDLKTLMPNALSHYRPLPDQVNDSARLLPGVKGQDTW
jgi:predicted Zn-dependent protease